MRLAGFVGERSYVGVDRKGCVLAKTVEFHDADMRRAWAEAMPPSVTRSRIPSASQNAVAA